MTFTYYTGFSNLLSLCFLLSKYFFGNLFSGGLYSYLFFSARSYVCIYVCMYVRMDGCTYVCELVHVDLTVSTLHNYVRMLTRSG